MQNRGISESENDKIFVIFRSNKSYTEKPIDCKSLNCSRERLIKGVRDKTLVPYKVSLSQIAKMLSDGYTINASVLDTTRLLILDIDGGMSEMEFAEICKRWDIVPNIYYRTFSYVKGVNERFRAIYKLDKNYNLGEYKAIYDMFLTIFDVIDTTSSNFKQLCHGTNRGVKLIHDRELSPRELAKRTGWTQPKSNPNPNPRENESLSTSCGLSFSSSSKFHYDDAIDIYLTLREYGLEGRLRLVNEDKREEYFSAFERAYVNGKKPKRGSVGAKLWGAMKSSDRFE